MTHNWEYLSFFRPPPFMPLWCLSAMKSQSGKSQGGRPSTSSVSDTPPSSPEGHHTPPDEGALTPPTPTATDDDDDVFITLPFGE